MDNAVYDIKLLGYTSEIFSQAAQAFAELERKLEVEGKNTFTEKDTKPIQDVMDTRLVSLEEKFNELEIK